MRSRVALLAAVMLTACAAEPAAEAQLEVPERPPTAAQEQTELKVKRHKQNQSVSQLLDEIRDNTAYVSHADQRQDAKIDKVASQAFNEEQLQKNKIKIEEFDKVRTLPVPQITCHGIAKQGGLVVCQTEPNAKVEVGRAENDTYTQTADAQGRIIVGFDRDEPNAFIRVGDARLDFEMEPRAYDTSRIDGLPKNMVSEYTADELARIRKASALKKVGFASKVAEIGFKDGFIYPVTDHIKTTNFGAQRILNGDPKRPHFGVDLAAPKGTPILAPAAGIVSLADDDMYFEGSLIMIDHGQGLISYYLHNEDVMVSDGQRVEQGEQIGTVGSKGRSTGPHLCWRLKWRGRNLDPELLTEWPKGN